MADTFLLRLNGLMFKKSIPEKYVLSIKPCKQIHTFFMRFDLDFLVVDKEYTVLDKIEGMKKGKVSKYYKTALMVLEGQGGVFKDVSVGDQLYIEVKK